LIKGKTILVYEPVYYANIQKNYRYISAALTQGKHSRKKL